MDVGGRWIRDDEALALVDRSGEPFNAPGYRRAWTEALSGWSDVSFGARAPDGTQAAVALVRGRRSAESVPLGYGGVVASRALDRREASSFLRAARRAARADDVRVRSVPIEPSLEQLHVGAQVVGWASVVHFDSNAPAEMRLTKKARQTIARAQGAGGVARPASRDPEPFLRLYDQASREWGTRYPPEVLRCLAQTGCLSLYDAELEGVVEASAAALVGDDHWMYWLAAQSEAGRRAELGYLALAALMADAHAAGVRAVNLGASAGLPGVARFKRWFGGVDVPVLEFRSLRRLPVLARDALLRLQRV
jgi:hypothetical protein